MSRFLSCLQHSRPCCIGYTNSRLRLEFVYPIQHGRSCCKHYIQYARDDERPHFCINLNKNIDSEVYCNANDFQTISSINYDMAKYTRGACVRVKTRYFEKFKINISILCAVFKRNFPHESV